jgi:hypothetical protein
MTIVPANVEPNMERCQGCIHFDDIGESANFVNLDFPQHCLGECICPDSDHYGHVVSFGHPACRKKEE